MKKIGVILVVAGCTMLFGAEHESLIDMSDNLLYREGKLQPKKVLESEIFTTKTLLSAKRWYTTKRVHNGHPKQKEILALVNATLGPDGLRLLNQDGIQKYRSATGGIPMVSEELTCSVKLPSNAAGGILDAKFDYIGRGNVVRYIYFAKNRKVVATLRGSGIIPQGADSCTCVLRLIGPGDMKIASAEIALIKNSLPSDSPDVIVFPMGYADAQFHIPEKTPFPMSFSIKRKARNQYFKNTCLNLELPTGYRLVRVDQYQKILSDANGKVKIDFSGAFNVSTNPGGFCVWRQPVIFLQADGPVSEEMRIMRYGLELDGKQLQMREIKLRTRKKLESQVPTRFITGIEQFAGNNLGKREAEFFVKLLRQTGYNAYHGPMSADLSDAGLANNMTRIGMIGFIRDGNVHGQEPAFIGADGKPFRNLLCPIASAEPGGFDKIINERLKDIKYMSDNWEPYLNDYKGCFCENCFKAFAEFAKISESDLRPLWPKQVIQKNHEQWVKFRSLQHAELVRELEKTLQRHIPGGHFVPMISRSAFTETDNYAAQYSPKDFLKYLKLINIWGPYSAHVGMQQLYTYYPGWHLAHYFSVRDAKRFVDKYSKGNAKIIGFPYGCHGDKYNSPEGIALETLSNFLTGYAGSLVYWFQLDGRYYERMAEANKKIACYEKMVYDWTAAPEIKAVPVSPVITPQHVSAWENNMLSCPELATTPYTVQTQSYRNGKQLLVAVGNFWEKAGVFVQLKVPVSNGKYVIRLPHNNEYYKVDGKILGKGVKLYVRTLNWEFFLIGPDEANKDYGKELNLATIEVNYQKLLPKLKKLMEQEDGDYTKRRDESSVVDFKFDETPKISGGDVTVSELRKNGKQALQVKSANYTAVVEPATGGGNHQFESKRQRVGGKLDWTCCILETICRIMYTGVPNCIHQRYG